MLFQASPIEVHARGLGAATWARSAWIAFEAQSTEASVVRLVRKANRIQTHNHMANSTNIQQIAHGKLHELASLFVFPACFYVWDIQHVMSLETAVRAALSADSGAAVARRGGALEGSLPDGAEGERGPRPRASAKPQSPLRLWALAFL